MCHRVGGVWLFCFWVEHPLSQTARVVVCARVMTLSVCAFLWCWLVVGALLGVWDDTRCCSCLQVAACCGQAAVWWFVCGVWVLCENWIVDASILFFCKFDFVKQFFCL